MNAHFSPPCPYGCGAGCPVCAYGVDLFQRACYWERFIPKDVGFGSFTREQVIAFDEWQRISDAYCAHIGFPIQRDQV